ncbi:hypothetical protein DWF00_02675 [Bosea caraganae]|uniref:Uncharacterized protein n=1 Tax=Bosea caraganae TaxID=2763117 RepID=A0A370L2T1_9HYPH|nr:hypothetical protein DWE98_18840 [Bosea caraganae]RDJ30458.1 hypothetical protein DWF00_02675 [Bosea caraganae]
MGAVAMAAVVTGEAPHRLITDVGPSDVLVSLVVSPISPVVAFARTDPKGPVGDNWAGRPHLALRARGGFRPLIVRFPLITAVAIGGHHDGG